MCDSYIVIGYDLWTCKHIYSMSQGYPIGLGSNRIPMWVFNIVPDRLTVARCKNCKRKSISNSHSINLEIA